MNLLLVSQVVMNSKARSTALASAVRIDENDARTDGHTVGHSNAIFEWRVQHNTPHFLKWRGIKIYHPLQPKHMLWVTRYSKEQSK